MRPLLAPLRVTFWYEISCAKVVAQSVFFAVFFSNSKKSALRDSSVEATHERPTGLSRVHYFWPALHLCHICVAAHLVNISIREKRFNILPDNTFLVQVWQRSDIRTPPIDRLADCKNKNQQLQGYSEPLQFWSLRMNNSLSFLLFSVKKRLRILTQSGRFRTLKIKCSHIFRNREIKPKKIAKLRRYLYPKMKNDY